MYMFSSRITILMLLLSGVIFAQKSDRDKEKEPPFEVFAGYSYLHEAGGSLNGWTGTFVAEIARGLGIAADFDGHYRTITEEGVRVSEREHGFTFGPHYAFHNPSRVTPIFYALFGGVRGSISAEGQSASQTGFAMNIGGALNVKLSEAISSRIIQIDAAYTRFNGEGTTSPRICAGLVFHFGKK